VPADGRASSEGQGLPVPPFPQHPELLVEVHPADPHDGRPPEKRHWTAGLVLRAMRGWLAPYLKSRILPGDFHPIISYLFTDWKCNLDCHYCWACDNSLPGMSEEVAKQSIDWLHSTTCRVLGLMGGEPLLRPDFVHKVIYYAAKQGFWTYLPTNARLLRPDVIDRIGDAGVAVVNFSVDAVAEKPGLPKALIAVRKYFDYLIQRQYRYGYAVLMNINICRNNLEDVRELTQIAHDNGLATDYHINEPPLAEQPHFRHLEENGTYINSEDWPAVDDLVDWLIARQRSGYKMVNSVKRIAQMKDFMRGRVEDWNCRAGLNSLIIRLDGSLAPCFPMYSSSRAWGSVGEPKFNPPELLEMKRECQSRCFSTLNHNLGFCYNDTRVIKWVLWQALHGFQGVTGSFED
jgi:MoaA/NifB/PqqE/SkfB family radical SAM enzyme